MQGATSVEQHLAEAQRHLEAAKRFYPQDMLARRALNVALVSIGHLRGRKPLALVPPASGDVHRGCRLD
ncbi:hypothetical protein [Pseudodesulfovibrio tunisiensis]|uniref:hypothetical protein n=1 Tax=Pseudodesulfovibrio tunisiensis TaxID=463192 RepID=UPI001FB43FDB|nr:hypothetical protein [Pseudodesulfovibrio tunisiensis]